MLAGAIIEGAHLGDGALAGLACVGSAGLAALAVWALVHKIESQPGQVFIEKQTGREIMVKRSAGALFFIPTRYWPYIIVAFGVLVAVGGRSEACTDRRHRVVDAAGPSILWNSQPSATPVSAPPTWAELSMPGVVQPSTRLMPI
jgi:hypothetical protein